MLINPKVSPPSVAVRPPIRAGEKSLRKGESVRVCVCVQSTHTHTQKRVQGMRRKYFLINYVKKKKQWLVHKNCLSYKVNHSNYQKVSKVIKQSAS